MDLTNYKSIFNLIEESQQKYRGLSPRDFREKYANHINLKFQKRSDHEYFDSLKLIIFYSGYKAYIVDERKYLIDRYFPDYINVANYDDAKKSEILSDKLMIRNSSKVDAVISNAKEFIKIIDQHGSFQNYIECFSPAESLENLMLLKEELECKFKYLGGITVYHFLMDIGLDVIKPDRVITRIFKRLGLIEDEKQYLKTIFHGRKFAAATGNPIRYVDIVLVEYGQQGDPQKSSNGGGICLELNPKCKFCGIERYCKHGQKTI